jgi:hypothetical protein
MNEFLNDFSVDNKKIIEAQDSHAINKLMAYHIVSSGGYMSVGSCMKSITNENLQEAIDQLDKIDSESDFLKNPYLKNIFLLSLQMAYAEGHPLNTEESSKVCNQTILFLTLESLARRGLIELNRNNMSFADGTENLNLAKVIHK